ncbi:alpha/beta fold hydrolase [Martelella endophytica]|uniref:HTH luxR-type domain-containing protein n=1 Tax=Martelella endophytica TaxID=1486262 RepID=A0A0D5LMS7_MAREN|nr:alpha/beta hydrolase [Martelella endophytica]AJY44618.1 hypothetical protein TM49_01260 [Martelella endophytica]
MHRLAEIPRLFKPSTLPQAWERDNVEVLAARRRIEIHQSFLTALPDFGLPGAILDTEGQKLVDIGDAETLPALFTLPPENDEGIAFAGTGRRLVILINLRRSWPGAPEGVGWLALMLDRAFIGKTTGATLTNSEYELLSCLLVGLELKEAAARLDASYDTKRKQLQIIFQKMEVTSQAALTRTVSIRLMSHFIESFGRRQHVPAEITLLRRQYGRDVLIHAVALENGTQLPVWEFGDRRGKPCLFFHPLLSPTVLSDDKIGLLRENGLRWLVVPRFFAPGTAEATADPLRALEDHADALADYVAHFVGAPVTCVATSAGVSWAVFFAKRYPTLVERLVIAAAPFPSSLAPETAGDSLQAALAGALRQRPGVLAALVRAFAPIARSQKLAFRAYRHAYRNAPADLRTIASYAEHGHALEWLKLIADRASASVVTDLAVNHRDWLADAADLSLPITLLQGEEDTMCPPAIMRHVAAGLPTARLKVVPDAGHHLAVSHFSLLANVLKSPENAIAPNTLDETFSTPVLAAAPEGRLPQSS